MDNIKVCSYCGKEFTVNNKQATNVKYCSDYCKKHEKVLCKICNKEFERAKGNDKNTCSKECSKILREQTSLEKYGVKNISQLQATKDVVQNKRKDKMDVIQNKRKQTSLERYGVDNANKLDSVKEKTKQTHIEKYGMWNSSRPEIRKSKSDKMKKKWQDPEYIKKYEQAVKDKLGSKSVWGSDIVKENRRLSLLERYGVDNSAKVPGNRDKAKQTLIDKYGVTSPLKKEEFLEKLKQTNIERYGVPYYVMTQDFIKAQGKTISKINKRIGKLLKIDENDYEFCIESRNYDLKKGNTLIEIDPSYTHNSTIKSHFAKFEAEPKDKKYHLNKTKLANEHGYHCIHIFDWDDVNKIKYMIEDKETLYARNLKIQEVPEDICDNFLNENHLQNTCKGQTVRLGLYKDNELIEIMTFGKPRYNKNYEYELLRLCTNHKYKVVGGSERLFKYFIENYKPSSIISYCDNAKFSGDVYNKLGFTLKSYGSPTCHWYNLKTGRHITNNLLLQRGFSQLHKDNKYELANKGDSNRELMINAGYVEVYDCGQSTFIWNQL